MSTLVTDVTLRGIVFLNGELELMPLNSKHV
jgi:hypothetical protein